MLTSLEVFGRNTPKITQTVTASKVVGHKSKVPGKIKKKKKNHK